MEAYCDWESRVYHMGRIIYLFTIGRFHLIILFYIVIQTTGIYKFMNNYNTKTPQLKIWT